MGRKKNENGQFACRVRRRKLIFHGLFLEQLHPAYVHYGVGSRARNLKNRSGCRNNDRVGRVAGGDNYNTWLTGLELSSATIPSIRIRPALLSVAALVTLILNSVSGVNWVLDRLMKRRFRFCKKSKEYNPISDACSAMCFIRENICKERQHNPIHKLT